MKEAIIVLMTLCLVFIKLGITKQEFDKRFHKIEDEISRTQENTRILEIKLENHEGWQPIDVTDRAPEAKCDFTGEVELNEYIEPLEYGGIMKPVLIKERSINDKMPFKKSGKL